MTGQRECALNDVMMMSQMSPDASERLIEVRMRLVTALSFLAITATPYILEKF